MSTTRRQINTGPFGVALQIDEYADGSFDLIDALCSCCGIALNPGEACDETACVAGRQADFDEDMWNDCQQSSDNGETVAQLGQIVADLIDGLQQKAQRAANQPQGRPLLKMPTVVSGGPMTSVFPPGSGAPGPSVNSAISPAPAAPPAPKVLTPEEIAAAEAEKSRILAMMGLEDDQPAAGGTTAIAEPIPELLEGAIKTDDGVIEAPPSKHAVVCDDFSVYKGDLLAGSKEYDMPKLKMEGHVVADCYAVAYEAEPKLTKRCVDPHRQDFISALLDCPETGNVRVSTVGDPIASEIAAVAFAGRLNKYLVEMKPAQGGGKPPPSKLGGGGRARDLKAQVDCMVAAAGAAHSAKQAVDEYQDAQGMMEGAGKMDPKRSSELYARMKKSKRLMKIAELAGRYRRVAASKQMNKVCHGTDDVVGVTVGNNPFRMIPSELANLAHPVLRLETMAKLVESRVLVWDQHGTEPVAKGPIVVVVDESGSMNSGSHNADGSITAKVEQAKALALAMAWIAAKQKRFCALVSFSSASQGGELAILPPGQWDQNKILDWLEHFFNGGTDMDVPMKTLPNEYWPKLMAAGAAQGKTDIVIVTDGEVNMPEKIEKKFMAWKSKEKVKLYSIILRDSLQDKAGDLGRVSDTVHLIDRDALNANSEAVGQVLSI